MGHALLRWIGIGAVAPWIGVYPTAIATCVFAFHSVEYIKPSFALLVFCVLSLETCIPTVSMKMLSSMSWEYKSALQIVVLTTPQFVRCKPIKNWASMRWIRSHFGPLYVITVCFMAWYDLQGVREGNILLIATTLFSGFVAFIAATALRPDNEAFRVLFSCFDGWNHTEIRKWHGRCMVVSLLLSISRIIPSFVAMVAM